MDRRNFLKASAGVAA
ncbi:MAG: twin-arginine translocation signal domain-containing protein, partial [Alphaproteobacteria bacterium]